MSSWRRRKAGAARRASASTHATTLPLFLLADLFLLLSSPPAAFHHRAAERRCHTRGEAGGLLAVSFGLRLSEGCSPAKLDIDFFPPFSLLLALIRPVSLFSFINSTSQATYSLPPSSFLLAPRPPPPLPPCSRTTLSLLCKTPCEQAAGLHGMRHFPLVFVYFR